MADQKREKNAMFPMELKAEQAYHKNYFPYSMKKHCVQPSP